MNKYVSAVGNTVTDTGLLFGAGNTVLNWHAAGPWGIAFNTAATLICGVLRFRAELGKNKPARGNTPSPLDSPGTSLAASTTAQFVATGLAVKNYVAGFVPFSSFFVPLVFAVGGTFAAFSFKDFSNSVKRVFRLSRTDPAPFAAPKLEKSQGSTPKKFFTTTHTAIKKLVTEPLAYWASGLIAAGGINGTSMPLFAVGGGISVLQAVWNATANEVATPAAQQTGKTTRFALSKILKNPIVPSFVTAFGCAVSAYVNRHNPTVCGANVFYSLAYAGFSLTQIFGGTVEAVRTIARKVRLPSATPL